MSENESKKNWRPGFKSMSRLAPQITHQAVGDKNILLPRLKAGWEDIVGAYLARLTEPSKIAYLKQGERPEGKLTLLVEPLAALEIQHMIPQILEKIAIFMGAGQIFHIRLEQQNLHKSLKKNVKMEAAKPAAPLSAERQAQLDAVENEELREALKKLALQVPQ